MGEALHTIQTKRANIRPPSEAAVGGLKLAPLEMEGSLETIKNYVAAYTTRYDGVKYAAAAELKEELRSVH